MVITNVVIDFHTICVRFFQHDGNHGAVRWQCKYSVSLDFIVLVLCLAKDVKKNISLFKGSSIVEHGDTLRLMKTKVKFHWKMIQKLTQIILGCFHHNFIYFLWKIKRMHIIEHKLCRINWFKICPTSLRTDWAIPY